MRADPRSASRSMSTCSSSRMKGGSSRRMCGSLAVPARMPRFEQLGLDLPSPAGVVRRPISKPAPWWPSPDPRCRCCGCSSPTRRTRSSRSSDSIASMTASIAAQAIGPPPKVVPSRSSFSAADTARDISSAAHGKPLPERLGGGDHVRHHAVQVGGERVPDAADAALDLIEDQQRADLVAAAAQRLAGNGAPRSTAPASPCTGSTITAAVSLGDLRRDGRDIAARHEAHIERRAREAVPLLRAPQVTAPGRGGAAVEGCFDGRHLRRARSCGRPASARSRSPPRRC